MPIFLVHLLVGIALSVASTLVQQIFAQDQKQKVSGVRSTIQVGGDNPLGFIAGKYATGGQFEYAGTWGHDGETPNAYFTKVISLSDLPVTALTGVYVNSERVTLDPTPHPDRGYPVLEYRVSGTDYLWVKFYNGTQTAADGFLVSTFGSDPTRPYEVSQIGRGVAYAHCTARVNGELFSGLPDFLFEMQGIPLYDPRKDSTVGGVGSQRLNNPATWTYSDNPVVAIYNILLGLYYDGDWFYGPQGTTQSQLPYANWSAQMNKCDELVEMSDGDFQARFRFGAEIQVIDEPQAIIGELLKSCEGRISDIGGIYKILVAEPADPVLSITDGDILISEGQTFDPFPGLEETYNGMTATYPEPEESWQSKEAPARYDAALELSDGGQRLPFDTDYSMVPYALQVQRLMEAALLETRQFRKHSFTGMPSWWEFEPLDIFVWTSTRNGYVNKKFLITVIDDLPTGNQFIGSQEIDPSSFNGWTPDDEIPFDTTPIVIDRPPSQPMTGQSVAPYVVVDSDGDNRRPGIAVTYTGGLDDVRSVKIAVKPHLAPDTDVFYTVEVPYDIAISDPVAYLVDNGILPNEAYDVRLKFVPISERATDWSDWMSVTTPDVRMGAKDISVELEDIAEEIAQQLQWISHGVRSTLEAFKRVGSIIEESERENYTQRQVLSREISVQMGNLEASFTEVIEVALGPGGAIATALESLYAAMGGSSAEVNVRWEALAGPAGYSARYALQAAVNDGAFRAATFFMDVPASALDPTRIVLNADQLVFTNTVQDTTKVGMVIEGGEVKFVGARAGRISSADGTSMYVDFDNKEIFIQG